MLDPVAVALKFAFLAVLYLFLLWVARSALRDLRVTATGPATSPGPAPVAAPAQAAAASRLRVVAGPGLRAGAVYDLSDGALLGRGDAADLLLEDTFASARHAQLVPRGDLLVLEDLGSTNGTYLNDEPVSGPRPLHPGDRIRIGDSEFVFER